ncbi:MAG: hypothetical protein AAB393_13390, partial [Bacteroidota bacterium]
LVRSGGIELLPLDPWYESKAFVDDLRNLSEIDLPLQRFPAPEKTRMRLALQSYCHVTEMDLPYDLLANLLRLRLGQKYLIDPFHDLWQRRPSKVSTLLTSPRPPSTGQKLRRITELAKQASMQRVADALAEVNDTSVRNAVYHSDYLLHDDALHMVKGSRYSPKQHCYTPRVPLDELEELISGAFAFHQALFGLYERCRRSFVDWKDAFLPYDGYKSILELLFDREDKLIGFRVYWPNGSLSEYSRTADACTGVNLVFERDGSINFMVGLYASRPGTFSPLVEHGASPEYAPRPGTSIRPHWPDDLKPYKLPSV